MKKMVSGILVAGILCSGLATQTVSASTDVNPNSLKEKNVTNAKKLAPNKKDIQIIIDDIEFVFDSKPIMKNNRVLIPFRQVTDYIGGDTNWNNKTKTMTVVYKQKKITLENNKNEGTVNGSKKKLDVPVQIINGRVYVPIRFVAEGLGADVSWDSKDKKVNIDIFEQLYTHHFYSNAKGELGAPITPYQYGIRYKQGIAEGRELVSVTDVRDITDNSEDHMIFRDGAFNIGGKLQHTFLSIRSKVENGKATHVQYYVNVLDEKDNILFEKEGELADGSLEKYMNYTGLKVLEDIGYTKTQK
ncbi:hypothetical protein CON36_31115 [Bacillus cereus]|uniref:Copper amine oxidase-like N-terminal domain-containing protein n=2 Tax=Bacillus cereus group TaxID=86661 RepID=A0A9X6ZQQ8_BACTU|nr:MULTISPECIES: copper amine oxidase N-terminal domain-containing protein [Bacillus cereus group]PDZ94948.1 hypothetical protein CON36_31115 [Bacillus cereus]PFJ31876.1 hypothetical protein COJ15_29695 [Bacillus thuringiensis]PGP12661.1 hypothetical protein COA01_33120 [Bacillus cereus]